MQKTRWAVRKRRGITEVFYGSGRNFPQVAALHRDSGYFRLNYGPGSAWGTSVVLLPTVWKKGADRPDQGAPVTVEPGAMDGEDLLLAFSASIAGLEVQGQLRFSPPERDALSVSVAVSVQGDVDLDEARPYDTFKPVMLSSMHIGAGTWDAQSAFVESRVFPIPGKRWMFQPPLAGRVFGLRGGVSRWQKRGSAPTIEIALNGEMTITGWVDPTPSRDPNDDNIALWASATEILRAWEYRITAKP